MRAVVGSPLRRLMRTPERGADTIVWLAATAPGRQWTSGCYFAGRRPATASPLADNPSLAERLWDHSAAMSGVTSLR